MKKIITFSKLNSGFKKKTHRIANNFYNFNNFIMEKIMLFYNHYNSIIKVFQKISNTFSLDYNSYLKIFIYWACTSFFQSFSNLITFMKTMIWILKLVVPKITSIFKLIFFVFKKVIIFLFGFQFPIRSMVLIVMKNLKRKKKESTKLNETNETNETIETIFPKTNAVADSKIYLFNSLFKSM